MYCFYCSFAYFDIQILVLLLEQSTVAISMAFCGHLGEHEMAAVGMLKEYHAGFTILSINAVNFHSLLSLL